MIFCTFTPVSAEITDLNDGWKEWDLSAEDFPTEGKVRLKNPGGSYIITGTVLTKDIVLTGDLTIDLNDTNFVLKNNGYKILVGNHTLTIEDNSIDQKGALKNKSGRDFLIVLDGPNSVLNLEGGNLDFSSNARQGQGESYSTILAQNGATINVSGGLYTSVTTLKGENTSMNISEGTLYGAFSSNVGDNNNIALVNILDGAKTVVTDGNFGAYNISSPNIIGPVFGVGGGGELEVNGGNFAVENTSYRSSIIKNYPNYYKEEKAVININDINAINRGKWSAILEVYYSSEGGTPSEVNVKGGTFTNTNGGSLIRTTNFTRDDVTPGLVNIYGGEFTNTSESDGPLFKVDGSINIEGGTFTQENDDNAVIQLSTLLGNEEMIKSAVTINGGTFKGTMLLSRDVEEESKQESASITSGEYSPELYNEEIFSKLLATDVLSIQTTADGNYFLGQKAEEMINDASTKEVIVHQGSSITVPEGVKVSNETENAIEVNGAVLNAGEEIVEVGHSYGDPIWTWNGDKATATFVCANDETHKETPEVTVTSAVKTPATCTEKGVTTYTATVEFNGVTYSNTKEVTDIPELAHSYKDGKCTVCGAEDPDYVAPVEPSAPVITAGANGVWQIGSSEGLSFTSSAEYADFQKVQVDGKDLDPANYTVKEGSTIVTLKAEYLGTLSVGKHTLAIVSDTGTATTEFTIKAAADSSSQTGDDFNIALYAGLAILAAAGAVGTGIYRRREQ